MEISEALTEYLTADQVANLDSVPFALYAVLVTYAARTKRLDEWFTLAYRRLIFEDPASIQEMLVPTRKGADVMHHETIGDAAQILEQRGLVMRERKLTKAGKNIGPGTPYRWQLKDPTGGAEPRWDGWGAALQAVIEQRQVDAHVIRLFAALGHLADRDGWLAGSVPKLAAQVVVDPKTLRAALRSPSALAAGIAAYQPDGSRDWQIQLGLPMADSDLARERIDQQLRHERVLHFPELLRFDRIGTTTPDRAGASSSADGEVLVEKGWVAENGVPVSDWGDWDFEDCDIPWDASPS